MPMLERETSSLGCGVHAEYTGVRAYSIAVAADFPGGPYCALEGRRF
jgi:hypothetical protein